MKHRNKIQTFSIIVTFAWLMGSQVLFSQSREVPTRKGWWNFNNTTNLLAPVSGYGLPLQLVGNQTLVNGPETGDYAARIGVGSHYRMEHQISPNGGGTAVNTYTLQIDFKVESLGLWHCFFQTNPTNSNDGDCFINPSGNIGVAATTYSPSAIRADEWYRLVVSVDNGSSFTYYLDGMQINAAAVQEIDGRFSLDTFLLMFADEDGEDNDILVSEISIWDLALTSLQVETLGGFWHPIPNVDLLINKPFLQAMTQQSVIVCWHDTLANLSRVEYGLTQSLGNQQDGTSEMVVFPYRYHNVQLNELQAGTKYYYRLVSGSGTSDLYSFTTLPDDQYQGHIRFLLFSDSQSDSAATGFIVRSAKQKVEELYGNDPDDAINLIMHCGDIVGDGGNISAWTTEFFRPFSGLSGNIPFMSVAGNHEGEHYNYYTYMKYDAFSAFPSTHPLFEKLWTYHMPRILFVGMNSNMMYSYGNEQIQWLDQTLALAESDQEIDFVFCFLHHPPVSELWGEGNTSYVSDEVIPVLQKYTKVQQLSYGHTHAYERGVMESKAEFPEADFRISCVGSGGGNRDRWGEYTNFDYPQIHTAIDHYFYIIYDFDLSSGSFEGTMFDLGNSNNPPTYQPADTWHRRLNQEKPGTPEMLETSYTTQGNAVLHASAFEGSDEVMSSRFQISTDPLDFSAPLFDQTRHWQDIYGVDAQYHAVDLNAGIDLSQVIVTQANLEIDKNYYARIRYRDQNLRWSYWSTPLSFVFTGAQATGELKPHNMLLFNVPNPVDEMAQLTFEVEKTQHITLEISDIHGSLIAVPAKGIYVAGKHSLPFNAACLAEGMYIMKLSTATGTRYHKMQVNH